MKLSVSEADEGVEIKEKTGRDSCSTPSRSLSALSYDSAAAASPSANQERDLKRAEEKLKEFDKNGLFVLGFGTSWFKPLEEEFSKPYYKELSQFVGEERKKMTIYPPAVDVFTWTRQCQFNDIKVIILGQDPYHGPRQAHGLCFSVQKGVHPPPSLQNIFKELENDIDGFKHPNHGDLTSWAKQGVLLLNAVLTVRQAQANSHANRGWEKFTDAVISSLSKKRHDLVFLLWGKPAQDKQKLIDKKKHHILKAPHPSPLSSYRGFFGCKHFSQANTLLKAAGRTPIDWNSLNN